jgi:hypothetical protein
MRKTAQILFGSVILAVTLAAAAVPAKPNQVLNGTPDLPLCTPDYPCEPDVTSLPENP